MFKDKNWNFVGVNDQAIDYFECKNHLINWLKNNIPTGFQMFQWDQHIAFADYTRERKLSIKGMAVG